MIYTSTPVIKNAYHNDENMNRNKSEINFNKKNMLNNNINNNNIIDSTSMQIINPFDSIASKKHQFQTFSNNNSNRINNRYSQVSNSISLSNSQTIKKKILMMILVQGINGKRIVYLNHLILIGQIKICLILIYIIIVDKINL